MPAKDKEVASAYHKAWLSERYKDPEYRKRIQDQVSKRQKEILSWFNEYRSTLSCSICGETNAACLDFHHREQSEKIIEIPVAVRKGWSLKKIQEEIDKCITLCSNCHRKLHWEERNAGLV